MLRALLFVPISLMGLVSVTGCDIRIKSTDADPVSDVAAEASALSEPAPAIAGFAAASPRSAMKSLAVDPDPNARPEPIGQFASGFVIRNGNVRIEVRSITDAIDDLRAIADRFEGTIGNVSLMTGVHQHREAHIELRMPSARFDEALAALDSIGKIESSNVAVHDVGEEYVDLNARLANARRLEARLLDLLATRTGKLEEVLAVERELARVRGEIERQEGRIRYLRTRIETSTLSVAIHEPYPIMDRPAGRGVLGEALRQAWRNFVGMIAGAIALSGVVIPLTILGVSIALLVRRRWIRRPQ